MGKYADSNLSAQYKDKRNKCFLKNFRSFQEFEFYWKYIANKMLFWKKISKKTNDQNSKVKYSFLTLIIFCRVNLPWSIPIKYHFAWKSNYSKIIGRLLQIITNWRLCTIANIFQLLNDICRMFWYCDKIDKLWNTIWNKKIR